MLEVSHLVRRFGDKVAEERGLYPKQPVHDQLVYPARLRGSIVARCCKPRDGSPTGKH